MRLVRLVNGSEQDIHLRLPALGCSGEGEREVIKSWLKDLQRVISDRVKLAGSTQAEEGTTKLWVGAHGTRWLRRTRKLGNAGLQHGHDLGVVIMDGSIHG